MLYRELFERAGLRPVDVPVAIVNETRRASQTAVQGSCPLEDVHKDQGCHHHGKHGRSAATGHGAGGG
jgi:hypothetical protein